MKRSMHARVCDVACGFSRNRTSRTCSCQDPVTKPKTEIASPHFPVVACARPTTPERLRSNSTFTYAHAPHHSYFTAKHTGISQRGGMRPLSFLLPLLLAFLLVVSL